MSASDKALSDFRVGVITFIGLALLVTSIILAGGSKGLLFKKTVRLNALLIDVNGLKTGSPVAMGGMSIGMVKKIAFAQDPASNQIEVEMEIRLDVRTKIKSDSLPSIRTMGMLGDRYVDISIGSLNAPPLEEGRPLVGKETSDFDKTLQKTSAVLGETERLLRAINQKEGSLGQFFYDQRFYERMIEISDETKMLIDDFKQHPRKYIKFSLF